MTLQYDDPPRHGDSDTLFDIEPASVEMSPEERRSEDREAVKRLLLDAHDASRMAEERGLHEKKRNDYRLKASELGKEADRLIEDQLVDPGQRDLDGYDAGHPNLLVVSMRCRLRNEAVRERANEERRRRLGVGVGQKAVRFDYLTEQDETLEVPLSEVEERAVERLVDNGFPYDQARRRITDR